MSSEQIFYLLGKVILGCVMICAIAVCICGLDVVLDSMPGCAFYQKTGLYCAGCGGTRAVISLLHGKVIQSFFYHPAVLYFVVNYVIFMSYEFVKKHFHLFRREFPVEFMIYIGVVVLLLQWIIKVILQIIL